MEAPAEVIAAAESLVALYGPHFSLLGERKGVSYYRFDFPAGEKTGFPFIYAYRKGKPVKEISDFDALEIIASFGTE